MVTAGREVWLVGLHLKPASKGTALRLIQNTRNNPQFVEMTSCLSLHDDFLQGYPVQKDLLATLRIEDVP